MDAWIIAARFVHFAAVAVLFGLPLFRLTVARDLSDEALSADRRRDLWRICEVAAVVAAASALVWFAGVAADMTGGWAELAEPESVMAVAFDTRFGRVCIARLAMIVATCGVLAIERRHPGRGVRATALVLSGAVAASLIGFGHAAIGPGRWGIVHLVSDAGHVLGGAAWLGGLVGLVLIMRRKDEAGRSILPATLRRFSRMATIAVAVLVLTGVVNAMMLIDTPSALLDTAYGRLLVLKLVLVAGMLGLAAFNRFVVTPAIERGQGAGVITLSRSVAVELALGAGVLASVAALGTVHPVL